MINVVIWLGKIKYSNDLAIVFARNNIRIVDENFENTDDFIDRFDSLDANVDVLVIADALLLGTDRKKLFHRIRQIEPNIRIVIVFPGYRNQYIENQISEYKNVYGVSDIIYEGNRLDEDYFADVIKKGYIYDYEVNVYDEPSEVTKPMVPETKCISIGILGFTHGCGVTNEVINIAGYISVTQNGNVKAIDFSGTGNLRFAKTKGVTYIVHLDIDITRIKKTSKAVVYDFGTPFSISSNLIAEKRCGRGMPNRIYIVKPELDTECAKKYVKHENIRTADSGCLGMQLSEERYDEPLTTNEGLYIPDKPISDIRICQNGTSRTAETEVQEQPNRHTNKTYNNHTYSNHTEISQSVGHSVNDNTYGKDGQTDDVYNFEDILENCQLETFEEEERKILYDALERLFYSENFKIGSAVLPRRKVKSRMYEIDVTTLQSAMEKLHKNEKQIKNMTSYVMSVIFNCITEDCTFLHVDPYLNSLRIQQKE